MAEQGIIDNIVSQKAFDELSSLNKTLASTLELMEKIVAQNIGGGGSGSKPTNTPSSKPYDDVAKAMQKIAQLESQIQALTQKSATEYGKLTQKINEQTVAKSALQKQSRLEATAVNEAVGAYARLVAEYELAKKAVLDLGAASGMTGNEFNNVKLKAANLEAEINRLHKTSGQYGKGANNMYNSTFQLTQVMRELPNFAIDARIGFMSLSNNLPMLMDGFNQLANSVDAMGNKMGNLGALKQFAKSLLSLNTIMIVGSTLLVLYGDKIVELFTGKIPLAKQAQDDFVKSLKDGNNAYSTAFESVTKVNAAFEAFNAKSISKTEALKIYNDTLGKTFGHTNDLAKAEKNVTDKTPAYLKAMEEMAFANIYLSIATKEAGTLLSLNSDKTVSMWTRFKGASSEAFDNLKSGKINMDKFVLSFITGFGQVSQQQKNTKEANDNITESIKGYMDHYKKSMQIQKDAGLITGEEIKDKEQLTEQFKKQVEALDALALRSKSWVDVVGEVADKNEDSAKTFAKIQTEIEKVDYGNTLSKLKQKYDEDTYNLTTKYEKDKKSNKDNKENIIVIENYGRFIISTG